MDRGAWQATVHGVTKSWTLLSDWKMTTSPVLTTFSHCSLNAVWTLNISAHAVLHLSREVPFHPFSFFKYLFIWLYQVLFAACRIFSCNMQTLSCGMWDLLVVPWPGIKPGLLALTAWSLSHQDHQGSPSIHFYSKSLLQAKLKHQVSRLLGVLVFFFFPVEIILSLFGTDFLFQVLCAIVYLSFHYRELRSRALKKLHLPCA